LPGLTLGTHELDLEGPAHVQDKIVFEAQPSAALYLSLRTAQNLGVLDVVSNEDEAELYLNGDKYRRATKRGRLIVYLVPRKYTVRMQKDGFAPTAEQTVEVRRGEETRLKFDLLPAKATLAVHRAPPGTEVWVDGARVGTAQADGEFSIGTLDPGKHTVSLRHDRFKPLQSELAFASGKTVELQGTLEAAILTGTLKIDVTPQVDVRLRLRREGESQEREVSGGTLNLPEGSYTVTGSAPQYQSASATVRVTANSTATASLVLRRLEAGPPPKAAPTPAGPVFVLDDWMKTPGWVNQGGLLAHHGGEFVLAPPDFPQGTIRFTAVVLKGKRLEWVIGYRDTNNYLFFQVDDKNYTSYEMANGKRAPHLKAGHKLDRKQPMTFSISITPKGVATSALQEDRLVTLDDWNVAAPLLRGKFGFHIPDGDTIGMKSFQMSPN
jgi:hypothetical protein